MINKKLIENSTFKLLKDLNINSVEEIDLVNICKLYDIKLEYQNLENNISGLYILKNGKSYIICNINEKEHRKRFTIAHELGHFFLHKDKPLYVDKNDINNKIVFHRNEDSMSGELMKEREANAFAAALLMPEKFIKDELIEISYFNFEDLIINLAEKFKVSHQAMSFRLANLGYTF